MPLMNSVHISWLLVRIRQHSHLAVTFAFDSFMLRALEQNLSLILVKVLKDLRTGRDRRQLGATIQYT